MEKLNFKREYNQNTGLFTVTAFMEDVSICECKVSINKEKDTWTISSWYTTHGYGHKGYGTKTLKVVLAEIYKNFGIPNRVEYVWNGANEYVFDWMSKHFGAISKCPLAVQKYQCDDDWESHIYILNRDKVLKYFDLVETM